MRTYMSDLDIVGDMAIPGYDSLGDVDIMGDDPDLVLEALSGEGPSPDVARAMARARDVDPNAVLVKQQILRNLAYQIAGFTATVFPIANPTQPVSMSVVRPFKPYELIVDSTLTPFFTLDSAKINGRDQLIGNGPIPLAAFSEAAFRSKFRWETINTSAPLQLQFTMIDVTVQRTLRGAFFGAALMK